MDFNFSFEFKPNLVAFERELKTDLTRAADDLVKEVVELAPGEMSGLMGNDPPSAFGEPPAKRTGFLAANIKGAGDTITLPFYAEYLDPFFGGKLNRPFVSRGIDEALVKVAERL